MVYYFLKDYARALNDFNMAIEIDPQAPASWYFRALIREASGDLASALQDVNRAREMAPPDLPKLGDIESLHRRIVARLNAGKPQ